MYTIFEQIINEKKLKLIDVARGAGIPYSSLTDWKAGRYTPKADKMQRIAAFLNVSSEYLMTGKEPVKSYNYDITDFEYQIILAFRKNKNMQESVLRLLNLEKNAESTSLEQAG